MKKDLYEDCKITDTHIYFWGSFLSNFYPSLFMYKGTVMQSSEQAFMYEKALCFGDEEIREKLTKESHPYACKKLGRKIKGFSEERWKKHREEAMYKAIKAKFDQDSAFKEKLLKTEDKILVEGSPYDKIWGVGLIYDDPKILDKNNWKGLNLLGKILMKIRDERL